MYIVKYDGGYAEWASREGALDDYHNALDDWQAEGCPEGEAPRIFEEMDTE